MMEELNASAQRRGDEQAPVDVAVLTVIPIELQAVLDTLGLSTEDREKDPDDGTLYYRGILYSEVAKRDYHVVLTCVGTAGNPGATAAAQNLIMRYRPGALFLVGIAAGIRDKVRIGNVVVSERVVSYEPAALVRKADGTRTTEARPEIDRIPHTMLQDVTSYRPDQQRLKKRFGNGGGRIPVAHPDQKDEYQKHVARAVEMRIGTIASGEKLLRDPSKLLALRAEMHGKTEVGEMEAAGLVEACRRSNVPWLVIRGISDFGDELKSDDFHAFAAHAAAAVLADFLAQGLHLDGGRRTRSISGALRADIATSHPPPDNAHLQHITQYVFGRPIDCDQDFVGRRHEQAEILRAINDGQPVQILGESLMGKTSLLKWIQRHVLLDRPVVWLDPTRGLSPVAMVHGIAEALGCQEQAEILGRPHTSIGSAMNALEVLEPFILLIDDADTLATLGRDFDVSFFNAIRSRVQSRKLTWVSASRRNLYDLFKDRGLTSAFLNDSRKIWVGPLEDHAAMKLARRRPNPDDLVRYAGKFAYCLQWLGDYLTHRDGSVEQACDAFAMEMESLFSRWWQMLELKEQQMMQQCAKNEIEIASLDDRTRRRLRMLVLRGLLAEQDGYFMVKGEAFREFVCNVE